MLEWINDDHDEHKCLPLIFQKDVDYPDPTINTIINLINQLN